MFQEFCSSRQQWSWRAFTWPLNHMHAGPMHDGMQLERVEDCAPIAAVNRAKRRISLDGDSWDAAA